MVYVSTVTLLYNIIQATCFDYNPVIFRPILTVVLPDAVHTLGSHRVYISGIFLI